MIRNKKINTIVALKLDRITRSIYDWEKLMTFLDEDDTYLDCANDEINTTNANGKMVSRLLMSVSQNEIERTSERTKIDLAGAIKMGHIPNQVFLGYKHEDKRLVIDYSTKDVVERIFDLYYNGNFYQKISNILNEEQVLGKTNWRDSSIVGAPIKDKNKYGLSKQVGKSDVFIKKSLRKLQDKMRIYVLNYFIVLKIPLKQKKSRNRDYLPNEMDNYIEMKKNIEKHQEDLYIANKKSLEFDNNSNEVKKIVDNLKTTMTSKDKYVLKQDDKDKILNFLQQVNDTNSEYWKMKELSITLNNVDDELNNNRDKIKTLTENNNALNLRVSTLEKKIDKKDDEVEELKEKNRSLKHSLDYLKDIFVIFIKLIKNRIFSKKETREKYMDFSRDLYAHGVLEDKEMFSIKDDYNYCKNHGNDKKRRL